MVIQTEAPPVSEPAPAPAEEVHPDKALALPAPAAVPPPAPAPVEAPPSAPVDPKDLVFDLPTDNRMLLKGQPDQFYMFVDRYTPEGQIQVWEAGGYGFVRNPRQTQQGIVYTKFHEGIDIAPVLRDAKGEPLDEVRAIADGTVAYVTASSRTSNYGNYVVVLHPLGKAGVFFSLYAHLRSASVVAGTGLKRGQVLGQLGYTGDGIDRRRAHVHLECGLILSERYDEHFALTKGGVGGHGNYHGSNLIGMNVAAFLLAHQEDPKLMPDVFLQKEEVYFKVTVPNRGAEIDLTTRYPWLRKPGAASVSWEISFTGPGVPVAVRPSDQAVTFATVTWVKPFPGYHSWNTRSLLGGSGNTATLNGDGSRFVSLVAGDF